MRPADSPPGGQGPGGRGQGPGARGQGSDETSRQPTRCRQGAGGRGQGPDETSRQPHHDLRSAGTRTRGQGTGDRGQGTGDSPHRAGDEGRWGRRATVCLARPTARVATDVCTHMRMRMYMYMKSVLRGQQDENGHKAKERRDLRAGCCNCPRPHEGVNARRASVERLTNQGPFRGGYRASSHSGPGTIDYLLTNH